MITAIEIENFKAIGKRQRIELKPLTLLFGPNSAGKSTIIHAIHYAREIFERHNLDADRTIAGGGFVDLGGFRNFVHNRDLNSSVTLRFDITVDPVALPEYGDSDDMEDSIFDYGIVNRVSRAWVEISVSWSDLQQSAFVARYSVGINDEPLATLRCDSGGRTYSISEINWGHSIFERKGDSEDDAASKAIKSLEEEHLILHRFAVERGIPVGPLKIYPPGILYEAYLGYGVEDDPGVSPDLVLPIDGLQDALPNWGVALDIGGVAEQSGSGSADFIAILSQLVVGPGEILRDALKHFRYVGPLREVPGRNYALPRYPEDSRWANGLAAWDAVTRAAAAGDYGFMNEISHWLSSQDNGYPGYQLSIRTYKELDTGTSLYKTLSSERAFDEIEDLRSELEKLPSHHRLVLLEEDSFNQVLPSDVGVGISQILPVVVATIDRGCRLLAIEQPELHLHPAVQVTLGDLFISQIVQQPERQLLIETHSEHLLLRLLRRVRETFDPDAPSDQFKLTPDQLAVIYLESSNDGVKLRKLRIDESGEFLDRWPRGFFEERAEELFG